MLLNVVTQKLKVTLFYSIPPQISKNIVQSKTEEINQQLKSLDTIVRQSEPKPKPPTGVKPAAKSNEELVANYESEMKKAEETLDGLASFNVTGDK